MTLLAKVKDYGYQEPDNLSEWLADQVKSYYIATYQLSNFMVLIEAHTVLVYDATTRVIYQAKCSLHTGVATGTGTGNIHCKLSVSATSGKSAVDALYLLALQIMRKLDIPKKV